MALFKYFPPHSAPQLAKLHRFADIAARVLLERRLAETGDWDPPSTEKKKMGENSRSHGATTEEKDGARCQHPIFDPWRVWDVFTKLFKKEQLLKPFDVKTINPTIHRAKFMSRS